MTERDLGSYPGGPRRRRSGEEPESPPARLQTLEERAEREARARRSRGERQRRRRIVAVLVVASVVAGGVGFVLGVQADKASEELTAQREQARRAPGLEGVLRGEADRVIQQMWLSEILERQPGGGR